MCHPVRYQRFERDLRERERIAPDVPAGDLRVGDADRERVAALLRVHAAEGRLTTDELEERLEGAYGARTGRELRAQLADLPRERPSLPRRRPAIPVVPLGIMVLIAAALATGAWWLMWMIWPLMILAPRHV